MSLALHLRLRDEPEAAAVARRAIGATLAAVTDVDADAVSLVVTEVIGRLSPAAGGAGVALDVRVDVNAARLRVHVTGPARREDPPPQATPSVGWSLLLMERTVDRWGIDDGPVTRVWFEIDLPSGDGARRRSAAGTARAADRR